MKFAHMADVHLGGWQNKKLRELNFRSFEFAINKSINEKVEFILIAGDLFNTAFPGMDILKQTFKLFNKIKENNIPVFIIGGSHDYTATGNSYIDLLEAADLCVNVAKHEIIIDQLVLMPTVWKDIEFYGYPGRKSGLEVKDLKNFRLLEGPNTNKKIVLLHTTFDFIRGDLPIDCLKADDLPEANYYALGHIHENKRYSNVFYPGPVFPNSFTELEKLKFGSFNIIENGLPKKIDINLVDVEIFNIELMESYQATIHIINELSRFDIKNKIVLLRLSGQIDGKISDINFKKINDFVMERAYTCQINRSKLKTKEIKLEAETENLSQEQIEKEMIDKFMKDNPSKYNKFIPDLINAFNTEKQEGETNDNFQIRVTEESKRVFEIK